MMKCASEIDVLEDKLDFDKESYFCDFLETNIVNLCNDLLNEKYISHQREFHLCKHQKKGGKSKRVDFFITTDKGNVLCEVKNPTDHYLQLTDAVSQMMSYLIDCEQNGMKIHRYIIITNKYSYEIQAIINRFKLPFEVFVIGKNNLYKLN